MNSVLLINNDDILHYTTVSPNIDLYKINPHILNAQVLYTEPLLGTTLYEKLLDLVETGDIDDNAYVNYKTLLEEYITAPLVHHTMELYLMLNTFTANDAGVIQFTSDNTLPVGMSEIERLSNKYKNIAGRYDDKLRKYLCENSSLFPEYTQDGLIEKAGNTQRISGWNLSTKNL